MKAEVKTSTSGHANSPCRSRSEANPGMKAEAYSSLDSHASNPCRSRSEANPGMKAEVYSSLGNRASNPCRSRSKANPGMKAEAKTSASGRTNAPCRSRSETNPGMREPAGRVSMMLGKAAGGLLLLLGLAVPAQAHHILGIPHYAYEDQYPQTPVLTYLVQRDDFEVKMTGYPGVPQPGEPSSLHVYIKRISTVRPFPGGVTMTITRDRMIGEDPVIYGPVRAKLEDSVYKFFPRFDDEANYNVRIEFSGDSTPWTIELPMVAGDPGSPVTVVAGIAVGVLVFLVVIRAIRIKMRRASDLRLSKALSR